jgi:general secretion pathway protein E
MHSSDAQSIRRVATSRGMDTLRDDGARKALMGVTTVEEVVVATQDDMFDE